MPRKVVFVCGIHFAEEHTKVVSANIGGHRKKVEIERQRSHGTGD